MKNKKQKSDAELYKQYRNSQYALLGASWVALLIPDGILLGVNWNEWVKTSYDSVKVSIGLVLTVMLSLFMLYKRAKEEFNFTKLTTVIVCWAFVGLIYLFSSLLTEMLYIIACTALGLTVSVLIDIPEEYYKNLKLEYAERLGMKKKSNRIAIAAKSAFGIKEPKEKKKNEVIE